jgi:hypothetical protein
VKVAFQLQLLTFGHLFEVGLSRHEEHEDEEPAPEGNGPIGFAIPDPDND